MLKKTIFCAAMLISASTFAQPQMYYPSAPDFSATNQLYTQGNQQIQKGIDGLGKTFTQYSEAVQRKKERQELEQLRESIRLEREQARKEAYIRSLPDKYLPDISIQEQKKLATFQNRKYNVPVKSESGDIFYCEKGHEDLSVNECYATPQN